MDIPEGPGPCKVKSAAKVTLFEGSESECIRYTREQRDQGHLSLHLPIYGQPATPIRERIEQSYGIKVDDVTTS